MGRRGFAAPVSDFFEVLCAFASFLRDSGSGFKV